MIDRHQITDDQIDEIFNAMPGGVDGWLKSWGYRQFARAIEARAAQVERGACEAICAARKRRIDPYNNTGSWAIESEINAIADAIRARGTGGEG